MGMYPLFIWSHTFKTDGEVHIYIHSLLLPKGTTTEGTTAWEQNVKKGKILLNWLLFLVHVACNKKQHKVTCTTLMHVRLFFRELLLHSLWEQHQMSYFDPLQELQKHFPKHMLHTCALVNRQLFLQQPHRRMNHNQGDEAGVETDYEKWI